MPTEPHIGVEPEAHTSGNILKKNADLGAASPCPKAVINQNPVKKQTRQWAAWTRQEEENFFNALRLVGKDFDKITYRVQTKNKDQVRHYYYRLIRRMNKLLGPGFCLDAKNSKDTIAAMLRWWSLLEKYSCTASKLHLKPRRFKVFVEALEHQLLKDRKKSRRRRPHGECCHSSPSTATISLLSKAHGNDARLMKVLIVDGHNVQKVGSAKATSSLKHNVSTTSSCNRSDPTLKNVRQRRRTGNMSPACDKMEEKAAIYGVNLVAYAAEHLEQTTGSVKRGCHDLSQAVNEVELPHNLSPSKNLLSPTSQSGCLQNIPEINGLLPVKLKLQLFPVNEVTRLALEKDEHNPHLELTLSARKKMCSVLEHLNRKWGNSSIILSGELMIFPYSRQEALSSFKRWTSKDTVSTAADVYAAIGCPTVFRLRYGWFPHLEVKAVSLPASVLQSLSSGNNLKSKCSQEGHIEVSVPDGSHLGLDSNQLAESNKSQPASTAEGTLSTSSSKHKLSKAFPVDQECNNPVSSGCISHSLCLKESSGVMKNQWEDGETVRASDGIILSAGEWADSLTNITVGDLLSEASRAADANYSEPPAPCLQSIPFSCDSFDAAIAAHISSGSKELQNHVSIWDGEETRDAFSFQKLSPFNRDVSSPTPGALNRDISHDYPVGHHGLVEDLGAIGSTNDLSCERNPVGGSISSGPDHDDSQRGQSSTDMFWPDSLGPLDLDVCSRYQGPELILGDSVSLSGLNRLIASSLDAFQNCSFFSSDKKECLTSETDRVKISSNITYER